MRHKHSTSIPCLIRAFADNSWLLASASQGARSRGVRSSKTACLLSQLSQLTWENFSRTIDPAKSLCTSCTCHSMGPDALRPHQACAASIQRLLSLRRQTDKHDAAVLPAAEAMSMPRARASGTTTCWYDETEARERGNRRIARSRFVAARGFKPWRVSTPSPPACIC